jgi:hypothetical protein
MSDAPASAAVPLSRSLGTETPRHHLPNRDGAETIAETPDLQALARLVLTRDTRRDSNRDRVSRTDRAAETPAGPPFASASAAGDPSTEIVAATWCEAEEERAAIVEHDGKIPREWAEGFARLDPDGAPGDVPLRRWQAFIDDIGRFFDDGWADKAAALGWGPLDLFGCDRERPFARIDHAGLLWLLNGDRLVELDRHRAVIETRTGARQTFRRRPLAVGEVVLAWELAE